jgi:hypothetical protein
LSFFPPPFFVHVGPVQTTILSRLLAFIMSEAGAARRCTDCDTHAPGLRSAGFATVAKPAAPPHISAIAAARRPILSWCPAAGQKSNSLLVTPVSIIQANGTAEEAGRRRLEGLRRPAPVRDCRAGREPGIVGHGAVVFVSAHVRRRSRRWARVARCFSAAPLVKDHAEHARPPPCVFGMRRPLRHRTMHCGGRGRRRVAALHALFTSPPPPLFPVFD